jgi:peptidoglycan/xylan/chitin deacetylase (PgdA/CDA1 family)
MKQIIKFVDRACSRIFMRFIPEKASLLTFLFHGLFLDEKEIASNHVDPQQRITVAQFEEFVEFYVARGYKFVSPDDVMRGLRSEHKYIMITFDDGYFNNSYALPVLRKYRVPAVFFISTNNILHNKSFWWDIVYRILKKKGHSDKQIAARGKSLKALTADKIEEYLVKEFGSDCLKPIGSIDRPFTPDELKAFAQDPWVYLGNHTSDHGILTNYSMEGVREQIMAAQYDIYRLTGVKPIIISYPNGSYSGDVLKATRESGIMMGITIDPTKNYLPINMQDPDSVHLGRFILVGDTAIKAQCDVLRSEFSIYNKIKNLIKKPAV